MTSDNPAGQPTDDFEPGDSQFADEVDDAQHDLVDEALGDQEYDDENEDGEYYDDDEYDDDEYGDAEDFDDDDEEYDDDEYDDDEYDDDDENVEDEPKKKKKRRRVKLHCFNCNRPEGFYTANKGRWFHSYFLGLTFGFGKLIGPFKCQCCGHNRLLRWDFIHPRIWIKKPTVDTKNV